MYTSGSLHLQAEEDVCKRERRDSEVSGIITVSKYNDFPYYIHVIGVDGIKDFNQS